MFRGILPRRLFGAALAAATLFVTPMCLYMVCTPPAAPRLPSARIAVHHVTRLDGTATQTRVTAFAVEIGYLGSEEAAEAAGRWMLFKPTTIPGQLTGSRQDQLHRCLPSAPPTPSVCTQCSQPHPKPRPEMMLQMSCVCS